MMKRVQLFEFEDFPWLPNWLRVSITNLIVIFNRTFGVPALLAALIAPVLREHKLRHVVDLGSGAGGSMPEVLTLLREEPDLVDVEMTLTDLYPNADALKTYNQPDMPHLRYEPKSVNATEVDTVPDGLRTMINSFHHLRPEQAKAVLGAAQASRQPFLIY
ncbi:MAG: hypothetical protein AAF125_07045, partial [Chloroflexota bacterium]